MTAALPAVGELLQGDEAQPFNDFRESLPWRRLSRAELPAEKLRRMAALWWPVVGGRARHAYSSIVSNLDQEDGKVIFREALESLENPEKDPEVLWRRFAEAVGCSTQELDRALATPLISVSEYLATVRRFGHDSAHEGAAVLHLLASQLGRLNAHVGDVLSGVYGLPEPAVAYFRLEAARWTAAQEFAAHLVGKYCDTPYKGYEGRRAAREVAVAWQFLGDEMNQALDEAG